MANRGRGKKATWLFDIWYEWGPAFPMTTFNSQVQLITVYLAELTNQITKANTCLSGTKESKVILNGSRTNTIDFFQTSFVSLQNLSRPEPWEYSCVIQPVKQCFVLWQNDHNMMVKPILFSLVGSRHGGFLSTLLCNMKQLLVYLCSFCWFFILIFKILKNWDVIDMEHCACSRCIVLSYVCMCTVDDCSVV